MASQETAPEPDGKSPPEATRPTRSRRLLALRRVLRRFVFVVLFIVLSLSGAALIVYIGGRSLYRWHGFEVELRLIPAMKGSTRLALIPLGSVSARTHVAPIELVATLEAIRIEEIQKLVHSSPTKDTLARDFEKTARADLRNFVGRQMLLAACGALLGPFLLRVRRLRFYAVSSLLGVCALGTLLGSALTTFNGKAFETPTYSGTLKQAPWVIQFGKDAFNKIDALSQKLITVANNLNVLYGRIGALPDRLGPHDDYRAFRILHVSDLHNNLAALDFIREVADQFHVDFIVDTGDLTDFGSPPEIVMVRAIGKLPYPYVFVLGNHDSQTVADALAKLPNVTLLNGQEVNVKGITLLGLPNPASARASAGSVDTTPQELQVGGDTLLRLVTALPEPPDIVAIHDPEESRPLWGRVPLILCGHEHKLYLETKAGPEGPASVLSPGAPARPIFPQTSISPAYDTLLCNAGTTGAAGLRYFEKEKGVPFSCAVLTFDRATVSTEEATTTPPSASPPATSDAPKPLPRRPVLRAIDLISLDGSLGEYSISHHTYNSEQASPTAPTPTVPLTAISRQP